MSKHTKLNIQFGLFVMLGLIAVMFLALQAANLTSANMGDTYTLLARFDNIGALKVRAPVRAAGVVVGRVKSIRLDPTALRGVVELVIERRMRFPKDTSARIQTSGLLGDQYIALVPGGDTALLVTGDAIANTESAVVLEDLIGRLLLRSTTDAASAPKAQPGAGP